MPRSITPTSGALEIPPLPGLPLPLLPPNDNLRANLPAFWPNPTARTRCIVPPKPVVRQAECLVKRNGGAWCRWPQGQGADHGCGLRTTRAGRFCSCCNHRCLLSLAPGGAAAVEGLPPSSQRACRRREEDEAVVGSLPHRLSTIMSLNMRTNTFTSSQASFPHTCPIHSLQCPAAASNTASPR